MVKNNSDTSVLVRVGVQGTNRASEYELERNSNLYLCPQFPAGVKPTTGALSLIARVHITVFFKLGPEWRVYRARNRPFSAGQMMGTAHGARRVRLPRGVGYAMCRGHRASPCAAAIVSRDDDGTQHHANHARRVRRARASHTGSTQRVRRVPMPRVVGCAAYR
ncbi:hypothetical protein AB1Y20_008521 [Prymnesium parvum]|uniref:Uncharacterized protein n=1 Tax=Prymnesium parvum TaxID=97485 RepID=A0AB34ITB6_PRYPA